MKLSTIRRLIKEAEATAAPSGDFDQFMSSIEQLEKHAKERRVMEPNYSKQDLLSDIHRELPDIDTEMANKMVNFVFKHIDADVTEASISVDMQSAPTAEELDVGESVKIIGNVEYHGKCGHIDSFGSDKKFVIVDLGNDGLRSFHSSDVSYYAEDDKDEAEDGDLEEAQEDAFMSKLQGLKTWQVVIMNNYYRGKYSDYSGRYYYVVASSPEEAKQVVLDNADGILQDLLSMKSHNGKKILPRGSAVRITPERIGKIEDGTVAGRMSTAGYKKMFGPQGLMMVKLSGGDIVDVQGQEQGVAEDSDIGYHQTSGTKAGHTVSSRKLSRKPQASNSDVTLQSGSMNHRSKSYNFPKGTLFTQLPGGIFAKHPDVPETHPGYGHLIRSSEDNINQIHNALNGGQGVAEEQSQPVKYRATVEYGPTAADAHFVTVTATSTEEAEAKVEAWCKKKGVRNPMITINGADKPHGVTEMDSQGYRGSRDSVEDDAGKEEHYGKAMKAKDVTKQASDILNKAYKGNYSDEANPIKDDGNEGRPGKQRYPKSVEEGHYDIDDYHNARQGSAYGKNLTFTGYGGDGSITRRDDVFKGQSKNLPADPFRRTTGSVPKSKTGRIHKIARHGEDVDEASLASMRDFFAQDDKNTIAYDNKYARPQLGKPNPNVPPEVQNIINKLYRVGRITPDEHATLKKFNVAGRIKEDTANPEDVITVDVPLFIRLMEYAREDAKTDMDLHKVTEKLTAMSAEGRTLNMADYDAIISTDTVEEETVNEVNPHNYDSDIDYYNALNRRKPQRQEPDDIGGDDDYTPIVKKAEPVKPTQDHRSEEGTSPNGKKYNTVVTFGGPDANKNKWAADSYADYHWGAKKVVDAKQDDGSYTIYVVDNHKYGLWKPWKDEAPISKGIDFSGAKTESVSEGKIAKGQVLNEYAAFKKGLR